MEREKSQMASNKIRLKGHETFILREGWLTKGIEAIGSGNPGIFTVNSGADVLGVGTNMAKAIRYWLKTGGIITDVPKKGVSLTDFGQLIYENDPYIENPFTLWIIHCNIVMNVSNATSWYMFFNKVDCEDFTKEELQADMSELIKQYASTDTIADRSLKDDISALVNMYFHDNGEEIDPEDKKVSPFAMLGLIRKSKNRYFKTQPGMGNLDKMVILYLIENYFELSKDNSISIDNLLNEPNLPGRVLNLNRVMLNDYLDSLDKYLTVNRTAGLDTVYRKDNYSGIDILRMYYR